MNAFEKLKKQREEEQKRRESELKGENQNNYSDVEFEHVEAVGLHEDKQIAVRIVSAPFETRQTPYDCKFILRSKLLRDDGRNYSNINWKWIQKEKKRKVNQDGQTRWVSERVYAIDPDWTLGKMYNIITSGEWDNTGSKSVFKPTYGKTQVYEMVTNPSKNTIPESKFSQKFLPSGRVVMNVIDRMDDWCIENKHTKVLAQNVGIKEDEKGRAVYINSFLSAKKEPENDKYSGAYDDILEHFLNYVGDWFTTDAILQQKGMGVEVRDASDKKYIKGEASKFASTEPLTEEEKNYQKYNLDELTILKVTPASYLLRNHRRLFELFDREIGNEIGWSAVKELEEEIVKEGGKVPSKKEEVKKEETKKESSQEPVEKRERKPLEKTDSVKSDLEKVFPFFSKLNEEEQTALKESISGYASGVPVFKSGIRKLPCVKNDCYFPDSKILTEMPYDIESYCPVCGEKL